jgi:hypothetical protein
VKFSLLHAATGSEKVRRFGETYLHLQGGRENQARLNLPPASAGSKTARRFGGTYRHHLQGRILNQKRSKQKQDQLATCWFLSSLFFNHEDGSKVDLSELQGATTHS